MQKSKHIIIFDLIKMLLAFLVVNLHIESFVYHNQFTWTYYLGWYAVPIFVTLTFYFSAKYYLAQDFVLSDFYFKLKRYLMPFVFWSLIGFILHPDLITLKYFFRQILTGTAVDPPLYYLSTLIVISICLYLVRRLLHHSRLVLIVILLLLAIESSGIEVTVAGYLPVQIQLAAMRIFEFFKYALLGLNLDGLSYYLRNKLHNFWLLGLALFTLSLDTYLKWKFQVTDLSYGGIIQFVIVTLIMLTLIAYKHLDLGNVMGKLVRVVGSYSLGIYCIHTFYLERFTAHSMGSLLLALSIYLLSLSTAMIIDMFSAGRLRRVVS